MHGHGSFSIWFFIGILLTAYGLIITADGFIEYNSPPPGLVLTELHAPIWWGGLLLIIGLVYFIRFFPKKS
jgi:hypothetical protein